MKAVFDGKSNPLQNPNVEIENWGPEYEGVPYLPAVSSVTCTQDLYPLGACCSVQFGDVTGSEEWIRCDEARRLQPPTANKRRNKYEIKQHQGGLPPRESFRVAEAVTFRGHAAEHRPH
jgi:hypothetical protein